MILIDQTCYLLTVLIWVSMEYLAGKGHPEGGWRGSRTVNEKERMGIWIMPQNVDDKEMWKLIFIPLHHWWIMKRFACEYMISSLMNNEKICVWKHDLFTINEEFGVRNQS